jgi:mRNA-degrading endonuclease toxin of MazEF toxin-antitoxin module
MSASQYKQGDIILIRYPLSDKPEKSIIRPVVIISNKPSNDLDKDILVCQITTRLRNNIYSFLLSDENLTAPMPEACEARCNKIATVRVWDKIILDKISEMTPKALGELIGIIKTVF